MEQSLLFVALAVRLEKIKRLFSLRRFVRGRDYWLLSSHVETVNCASGVSSQEIRGLRLVIKETFSKVSNF